MYQGTCPASRRSGSGASWIRKNQCQYARANWAWVGPMLLWNLNFATIPGIAPADETYSWSALRSDWSRRPVYDAVKALPK